MRRRLAYTRDTLQGHLLPSTEFMELNYRPLLPPAFPLWITILLQGVFVAAVVSFLFAVFELAIPYSRFLWTAVSLLVVWSAVRSVKGGGLSQLAWTPEQILHRGKMALVIGLAVAAALILAPSARWAFAPMIAVAIWFSYLIATQYMAWAAVHPLVEWRTMRQWQSFSALILTRQAPAECPELATSRYAAMVVALQAVASSALFEFLSHPARPAAVQGSAGFVALSALVVPLPCYWYLWHRIAPVPQISFVATLRGAFGGLAVWFGYLLSTPAPGVFLLPNRWLRSFAVRELIALFSLTTITAAVLQLAQGKETLAPVAIFNQLEIVIFGSTGSDPSLRLLLVPLALGAPIITFFVIYWFVAGDLLARYWLAFEARGAYCQSKTASPWAISVNRMLNSRDRKEREHLLLGRSLFGDYPVLLHKPLLYQHAHLVGDSGSRKTSLGIAPLIAQLVAAQDCSVLILDLKGDRSLFETARLEAEWAGADFRWFSLEAEHSSHVFNPLEQSNFVRLTPNQKTQLILEGLSLNYGEAYGRGFYSAMNEVVLLKLLQHYQVPSLRKLHALLSDKQAYSAVGNAQDWEKAQHLTALVDRLASIHALNVTKTDLRDKSEARDAAIDMGTLMSRSQVVYFSLKSPVEPIGAPAVAKLALRSLFSASGHRLPHETKRVYVVVDEFQQIVSESMQLVLEQARGNSVHFIIAHQNIDQLDRQSIDIRSTVSSCTAFKQFFRASDPKTIRQIEELSGEGMFESFSWRQRLNRYQQNDEGSLGPEQAEDGVVQVMENSGFRLERNTIMDISSAPNTSFVSFTEGSHFTQYSSYVTPIISDYHISLRQYDKRQMAEWPASDEQTVLNPSVVDVMLDRRKDTENRDAQAEWDARIKDAAAADSLSKSTPHST